MSEEPVVWARPGAGWPEDPAGPGTPVAQDAGEVRALAAGAPSLTELVARQSVCRACPRLVDWREEVAAVKRRAFADEPYWGRPIAGWGDERAAVLIVGLAPAAHGGNRTGRVFTGDRSGDVLFASLHRCGLAALPTSVRAGDGQRLTGARMVAAVRCAPPANKPTPAERDTCAPWLEAELAWLAPSLRVAVCLGGFAWQAMWAPLAAAGFAVPRPRPAFGHGAETVLPRLSPAQEAARAGRGNRIAHGTPAASAAISAHSGVSGARHVTATSETPETTYASRDVLSGPEPRRGGRDTGDVLLIGCYHPSQQNTFTGRVTPKMLDDVFRRAQERARS